MTTYREIEMMKKHNYDIAEDFIKTHINIYGEYKRGDELIEKILKEAKELEDKQEKIKELIEGIQDPIIQATFKERLINGSTWEIVSQKIGYSLAHIQRLYKKSLGSPQIKKIMDLLK